MIPYQKEKIENAVCFFATEHRKSTKHLLYQTFLYKYLALFDFGYLKKYGSPALGMSYRAMKMGPVPIDLYERRNDPTLSEKFSFQEDAEKHIMVIPRKKPDLDYFSKREIAFMNTLIEIYAQSYITSRLMSDASHQEILAWKRTWSREQNAIIDFSLEFPENIFERSHRSLTFPEEVYLVQKGFEHCT